jgi:monoamine oxidase
MLAAIAGGDYERYWTESEVYRCKGGNQQLAVKLAEGIGSKRLILGLPVTEVRVQGDRVIVTARDGRTIECDDVIVTVPPTAWDKIKFTPSIPATLKPQMGVALKYLAECRTKFWRESNLSQYALTDTFLSQTWDGTDAQDEGQPASFHCFSGGKAAEESLAISRRERDERYATLLESIYPTFRQSFVRSRYMDWPNDAWVRAAYSFPAPGQVTTVGPMLWEGLAGRIHFAGEHCSYQFVGYMEGGLNSGVQLARRIARRDGLDVPQVAMPPTPERFKMVDEPAEESPAINPTGPSTAPTEPPTVLPTVDPS